MKLNNFSMKKVCRLLSTGLNLSMLAITVIFGIIIHDIRIFKAGAVLTFCAFLWFRLLVLSFGKRLFLFTSDLCRTLDSMIDGESGLLLCIQISQIPGLSYFEYHFPVIFVLLYFVVVVMVYNVVSAYQKKSLQQQSIIERIRTTD